MDKDNLYYIVEDGTNVFELIPGYDKPWIATKERAEKKAKYNSGLLNHSWVTMSIREYEDKFTDKKSEDTFTLEVAQKCKELLEGSKNNQVPSSYNLYSTGKHLLGMYNNKVIVINKIQTPEDLVEGKLSIAKVVADEMIVLKIREQLYEARMLKQEGLNRVTILRTDVINELIEELIKKAT